MLHNIYLYICISVYLCALVFLQQSSLKCVIAKADFYKQQPNWSPKIFEVVIPSIVANTMYYQFDG
jgi:hypothetical protein